MQILHSRFIAYWPTIYCGLVRLSRLLFYVFNVIQQAILITLTCQEMAMYAYKTANDTDWLLREDEAVYQARIQGRPLAGTKTYRLIDMFSGAGGMSMGFSKSFGHPFISVWANDFNKECVKT